MPGTYTSPNVQSDEVFEKIPMSTLIKITFSKIITHKLFVKEPDEYSREILIENIALEFAAQNIKVYLAMIDDNSLTVNIMEKNMTISMGSTINELLGLDSNFVFRDQKTDLNLPIWTSSTESNQSISSKSRVLILSDVMESQIYGDSFKTILRILPNADATINTDRHLIFHPVFYFPVRSGQVKSIRITLATDRNEILKTLEFPTVVVLHFKKQ